MDLHQSDVELTENLLNLHGIVRKNEEFFCHICDKSLNKQKITLDHIASENHKQILALFNDTFSIKDNKQITCKECDFHGGWLEIKKHVNIHPSAPWYKPTDFYKRCFDNFINEHEDILYCFICKCLLPTNVWQAVNHITSDLHVELKSRMVNDKEEDIIEPICITDKSYCSFIQNGITKTSEPFLYYCQICDCNVFGIINVCTHITGQNHLDIKELYEFEDITLLCNNLICIRSGVYQCRTCDCEISARNISSHLNHPNHTQGN